MDEKGKITDERFRLRTPFSSPIRHASPWFDAGHALPVPQARSITTYTNIPFLGGFRLRNTDNRTRFTSY